MAPLQNFEILSPIRCILFLFDSRGIRDKEWYGKYRSDRSLSNAAGRHTSVLLVGVLGGGRVGGGGEHVTVNGNCLDETKVWVFR